jgi:hypothetical protein
MRLLSPLLETVMRIKITATEEVFEGTPEQVLHHMHQTAEELKGQSFTEYLDGMIERLSIIKTYLNPPPEVRASESAYGQWMCKELMRLGRMVETDEPTTEEKKAEAAKQKAAAAKAKAEAAKAKAAAAKADKPSGDAPKAPPKD